jgi:catechol 2,3-dioxygenase-like lactoylglutathione lyase family enzyme
MRGIDLLAFADALCEVDGDATRIANLIRTTSDLHSAYSDLKMAADFATRALGFEQVEESLELPSDFVDDCCLALICSAIVFYARATQSESDHRKTFDIRPKLDPSELAEHRLICELRDDAIAHYGPGNLNEDVQLREDRIFLPEGGQNLMFASRQMGRSTSLADLIRRQAQRALLIMLRLFQDREAKMVEALNVAIDANPKIADLAGRFERDLNEAFGSAEAAAIALAAPRVGTRRIEGTCRPGRKPKSPRESFE